jgi:hypothetical protein
MEKIRDYQLIVNEFFNLKLPFHKEIIGYVKYWNETYPLLKLTLIPANPKKTIIITGGHHGDEPFAALSLIAWIKQFNFKEYKDYAIYIFPMCNPYGYETGSRSNGLRQDTNNDIDMVQDSKVAELGLLFHHFPILADLFIDVHGETYQTRAYCYEHKPKNLPSIAEQALSENDPNFPYTRQKTVLGSRTSNGVICPRWWEIGLEGLMEKRGIKYSITIEIPGKMDGQKRIEGGVALINSILKIFKEQK